MSNLTVGILTRGIVSMEWALGFKALVLPPKTQIVVISGRPFDQGRNMIASKALKTGADWIFFADDDTIPPPDAVTHLLHHDFDVVSGLYYSRRTPILPVARYDSRPHPSHIGSFTPGDIIDVDLVGAGCLLVRRKIFEILPRPWFEWKAEREDVAEHERLSEDFAFSRKLRYIGVKVKLDTGVRCRHVGLGIVDESGHFNPATTG